MELSHCLILMVILQALRFSLNKTWDSFSLHKTWDSSLSEVRSYLLIECLDRTLKASWISILILSPGLLLVNS